MERLHFVNGCCYVACIILSVNVDFKKMRNLWLSSTIINLIAYSRGFFKELSFPSGIPLI